MTVFNNPSAVVDGAVNRALLRSPAGGSQFGDLPQMRNDNTVQQPTAIEKQPKPRTRTFIEIHMNSGSKSKTNKHTGGVYFDRMINKISDFCKPLNFRNSL